MIADIATGNTDVGDVLLLIAAIVFAVAAIVRLRPVVIDAFLMYAGLCLVAVALLVL